MVAWNKTLSDSPLVASVRDLGVQFLDNDINISGQDAVTSVELPGDETFWIFGDTLEGPFETVRYLSLMEVLSNTGAIVPLQDISDGIKDFTYLTGPDGRRARQMIAFEPPEHKSTQRLWAIHGTHQNGSLYLYYHRITMDQKLDVFETFQLDGMGIARADDDYNFTRLVAPDGTALATRGPGGLRVPGGGTHRRESGHRAGMVLDVGADCLPVRQRAQRDVGRLERIPGLLCVADHLPPREHPRDPHSPAAVGAVE
ncbi:hypothetical protein [Tessaracoccus massiliensis]|uniref:hypothetical protein n=1 Tax=Tessaracoccus massiliensis TaxID=1522311 RepID=UPI001FEC59B8|nr:hypothetical protein [Tessaracoccus massiliensis]